MHGKCCKLCNLVTNNMKMDKSSKSYMRYCEMGLKSIKYISKSSEDEIVSLEDHDCDMILCMPCWNQEVRNYEGSGMMDNGN